MVPALQTIIPVTLLPLHDLPLSYDTVELFLEKVIDFQEFTIVVFQLFQVGFNSLGQQGQAATYLGHQHRVLHHGQTLTNAFLLLAGEFVEHHCRCQGLLVSWVLNIFFKFSSIGINHIYNCCPQLRLPMLAALRFTRLRQVAGARRSLNASVTLIPG